MTLNQLAVEISLEQGERLGDVAFVSQLETWIKDELVRINLKSRFRLLWKDATIPTVATVPTIDLPLDFRDPKFVRHPDGEQPIEFLTPIKLSKFNFDFEMTGKPEFCWFQDSSVVGTDFIKKLRLHPIPDIVYQINIPYYYYVQKGLLSNTHLSVPDEIILLLKNRVRMRIHRVDLDWDNHNAERADYNEALQDYAVMDRTTPSRDLVKGQTDLPRRAQRPTGRFRFPFET